jgi:hypothetical protein
MRTVENQKSLKPEAGHHVLELLERRIKELERFTAPSEGPWAGYTGITLERYVIQHGRPFVGIERPKGFRRRAAKQCFHSATMLAIDGRGTYVEGYAAPYHGKLLIEHAWIMVDAVHAIDVTWIDPERAAYFGVPIPSAVLAKLLLKGTKLPLSPLQRIVFEK